MRIVDEDILEIVKDEERRATIREIEIPTPISRLKYSTVHPEFYLAFNETHEKFKTNVT